MISMVNVIRNLGGGGGGGSNIDHNFITKWFKILKLSNFCNKMGQNIEIKHFYKF